MSSETSQCQNCKTEFFIEPEDFAFYEKIKVPPPTFCPDCRLQRRLAFFNLFQLYKRNCELCGKEFVSRYSADKPYRVYCPKCWWSDGWDPANYGRGYDFSRSFFEQFQQLWRDVPMLGLSLDLGTAMESPFNNDAGYLKQCYLLFSGNFNERCAYGYHVSRTTDCVDSYFVQASELSYDVFHGYRNYNCMSLYHSILNTDSGFLWQSENCQNCFASANLRNKQYYFFNKPYSREEYAGKIKELDFGSYKNHERFKTKMREHWLRYPLKPVWHEFSKDVSGQYIFSSKNCQRCFEVYGGEDCKYTSFILTPPVKDCYDYTSWGDGAELVYECMATGEKVRNIQFGEETGLGLYDAYYTKLCTGGSSNLFGCISMRKKSYCILNKQYTKEDYEKLVPRLIEHMNEMPYRDANGREYRYGEFFPVEISPFAYNETIANLYYPLSKEKITREGYVWKEPEMAKHEVTILAMNLPDHVQETDDSVLQETLGCISCGRAYRLIPQELTTYRKMNVPLPRQCFYCRLAEKLKGQPHPLHLWKRRCQCTGEGSENGVYQNTILHTHGNEPCPNELEIPYAPDRPEIVYCESCYQEEVI